MLNLPQTDVNVNPFELWLTRAAAAGVNRQEVEKILSGDLPIERLHYDARGHQHYEANFNNGRRHRIQIEMIDGKPIWGCIDCAERQATSTYVPYNDPRCPYAIAAAIQVAVDCEAGGHVSYQLVTSQPEAETTLPEFLATTERETSDWQEARKQENLNYRDSHLYQIALAVGDPEPWLEEEALQEISPAAEIAAELIRQHGHKLNGRIERALALVEAGEVEFPHYNTRIDEATGISECDCKDRAPRIDSGNQLGILTYFNGKGCKHCLARNIAYRLEHDQEMVAYRKQTDRIERRNQALPASVDNHDRLEDMLGYDDQPKTVAEQIAEARAQVPALKSQQPKNGIGSLPLAWQYR